MKDFLRYLSLNNNILTSEINSGFEGIVYLIQFLMWITISLTFTGPGFQLLHSQLKVKGELQIGGDLNFHI